MIMKVTVWKLCFNITGPVVGKFAVDLAIQKAKEAGIGMVTVRGTYWRLYIFFIYTCSGLFPGLEIKEWIILSNNLQPMKSYILINEFPLLYMILF